MCGIGGILRTDGQPIPEEWLDAIDASIAWRGPDGHGRFRDRVEIPDPVAPNGVRVVEIAFVHRRLSIIDHEGGHQPMVSERGRNEKEGLVAVVFNGCIYNHRELRQELESKGHRFATDHSDTEVLIHGWREWGGELVEHLEGMFAFGLWDRNVGQLVIGRDAFGEKPLYLAVQRRQSMDGIGTWCAFASAVGSLHALPDVGMVQPGMAWHYLWLGHVLHIQPWHPDVERATGVPVLEMIQDSAAVVSRFGELDPMNTGAWRDKRPEKSRSTSPEEIEQILEQAVQRRLEADVPLGCFLSGGVDSSLIALYALRHKPDLQTFTVKMDDARYDESAIAQRVASIVGSTHSTLVISANPAEDVLSLISVLRQPFGDSSILPTYWISKAARQHVKVALAGDGGDEMFLGYERYVAVKPLIAWRWALALVPSSLGASAHPKSILHKIGRLGQMARDCERVGLWAMLSVFSLPDVEELTGLPLEKARREHLGRPIEELRNIDICEYLPGDLLRKVDTASMAANLEVRCPFLDRDLARLAESAPISQLMPRGQRKGLLRQIARKYLPKEIVDRPKMGFAIPIGEWFRTDFGGMKTLLLDHLNSAEPFGPISLNRKAVQRFVDEHMSGKRDHSQRLFTLLTLSIWAPLG